MSDLLSDAGEWGACKRFDESSIDFLPQKQSVLVLLISVVPTVAYSNSFALAVASFGRKLRSMSVGIDARSGGSSESASTQTTVPHLLTFMGTTPIPAGTRRAALLLQKSSAWWISVCACGIDSRAAEAQPLDEVATDDTTGPDVKGHQQVPWTCTRSSSIRRASGPCNGSIAEILFMGASVGASTRVRDTNALSFIGTRATEGLRAPAHLASRSASMAGTPPVDDDSIACHTGPCMVTCFRHLHG